MVHIEVKYHVEYNGNSVELTQDEVRYLLDPVITTNEEGVEYEARTPTDEEQQVRLDEIMTNTP